MRRTIKTWVTPATVACALALCLCCACSAATVEQSQTVYEKMNDWSSGTAQSFRAGRSATLTGIRLLVLRKNGPRDLSVELRHVGADQAPAGPVLASGSLPGSAFEPGVVQWRTVAFDRPYEQAEGEVLSFTVRQGSAGDWYGWLEFGMSTQNPYAPGIMYYAGNYGPNAWTYLEGRLDFAFETLVVRRPVIAGFRAGAGTVRLTVPETDVGCVYSVQTAGTVTGAWSTCGSAAGTKDALVWDLPAPAGVTNRAFYRATVE